MNDLLVVCVCIIAIAFTALMVFFLAALAIIFLKEKELIPNKKRTDYRDDNQ